MKLQLCAGQNVNIAHCTNRGNSIRGLYIMTLYFVFQNVVLAEQSDQVTQESQDLQAKVASKEEIIQAQVSEVIKSCFMPIAQCTVPWFI